MFPGGSTEAALQQRIERIGNEWEEGSSMRLVNAVDTDTGEIVGAARWHFYFNEKPESEWSKDDVPEDWGEGANGEACKEFFGAIHESRKRIMVGNPHILLSVFVTHPREQKRGAGSALIKWGFDIADQAGLPVYLEATPAGYPVYKRLSFQDVDAIIFQFKPFSGQEGFVKITNMIRPPLKKA